MGTTTIEKTYTLEPSWKQFFGAYLLAVVTIPLGLGLIALYFIRRKHKSIHYIISDTNIKKINATYEHTVDLVSINKIILKRSWLQKQLKIGTLVLQNPGSAMILRGLKEVEPLKDLLEQGIAAQLRQKEESQKTKPHEAEYAAGSMEKINYLTGLWQQGLISEEDFNKERKHLE